MKKVSLIFALILTVSTTFGQDYLGLSTGNYSGIHGIMLNPAMAADNRYRFELNVLGTSFNFRNNYLGLTRDYFVNNRFSFDDFQTFQDFKDRVVTENSVANDASNNNAVFARIGNRLNLPSIFMSTGRKSGLALNFQNRTSIAIDNMNADFAKQLYEQWNYSPTYGNQYRTDDLDLTALNWIEAGLTYGRVLYDGNKHFLKGGITGKYLGGISAMYFHADELTIEAGSDSTFSATTNGTTAQYGHSETDISSQINTSYRPDASSWGYDIGLMYEFRGRINKFKFNKFDEKSEDMEELNRRDKNKYSFRIGASLLDVGSLEFNSVPLAKDFRAAITNFNFRNTNLSNVRDFDTLISQNVTYTSRNPQDFSVAMPTALNLNFDLHLVKGFYVNAMTYRPFNRINNSTDYKVHTPSFTSVTPRWEGRVAGVYVPFTFREGQNTVIGTSVRLGPVFFGTTNITTLLQKDNILGADFHAGLKLPLAFGGRESKASKWFDSFEQNIGTADPDITNEGDQFYYQNDGKNERIENNNTEREVIVEKAAPAPPAQPIQITINNYNSGSKKGTRSVIDTKNGNVEIDTDNSENSNSKEMMNLQEQIEYLKYKLNQKENLIDEMDLERERILNGESDGSSKKKIEELKEEFLYSTDFNYSGRSLDGLSASALRMELKSLQNELSVLGAENYSLDQDLSETLRDNEEVLSTYSDREMLAKLTELNSDYLEVYQLGPKALHTSLYKDYSYGTTASKKNTVNVDERVNRAERTTEVREVYVENPQKDGEIEALSNEISELREELSQRNATLNDMNSNRKWWQFKTKRKVRIDSVYVTQTPETVIVREPELKIIRDTVYIESPREVVEKVVTKVVRDTVTNTIEKNNVIKEIREVKVDNDKENLLAMTPFVVLFDVGRYDVKSVFNNRLDFYAEQFRRFDDLKIELRGYTDATGNPAKNLILSKKRADAVRHYLVTKGVKFNSVFVTGLGSDNPISDNETFSGKSQNRRVEVKFTK